MSMPAQKPGSSKQDYGTPQDLLKAIKERWGDLEIDLAAREDNKKAPLCITPEMDSLVTAWPTDKLCFLNPPFANMRPWAKKCSEAGARVIMLTPASVGSEWFAAHVYGNARVIILRPRFAFEGMPPNPKTGKVDVYPKDCMLTLWNIEEPGFELWRFK